MHGHECQSNLWLLFGMVAFLGCGQSENKNIEARGLLPLNTSGGETVAFLKPLTTQIVAFNRDFKDPNILNPIERVLQPHQYDVFIESELSLDKTRAQSVVTGISLEGVTDSGQPLEIQLGIIGRPFDVNKGMFGNTTRIFSSFQNIEEKSQRIEINQSVNTIMTGLGLKVIGGKITKIELIRKPLRDIFERSDVPSASAVAVVDPGWAVVGFLIRLRPADSLNRFPFVSDVVLPIAELTVQ